MKIQNAGASRVSIGDIIAVTYKHDEPELVLVTQTDYRLQGYDLVRVVQLVSFALHYHAQDAACALSRKMQIHTDFVDETQVHKHETSVFYVDDILYLLGDAGGPVEGLELVGSVGVLNSWYLSDEERR